MTFVETTALYQLKKNIDIDKAKNTIFQFLDLSFFTKFGLDFFLSFEGQDRLDFFIFRINKFYTFFCWDIISQILSISYQTQNMSKAFKWSKDDKKYVYIYTYINSFFFKFFCPLQQIKILDSGFLIIRLIYYFQVYCHFYLERCITPLH